MNDTTLPIATIPSEVRLFLAAVRRELGDLDPEEVAEMTDGLEADLTDLVTERGPEALGDPKAYAQELRTAAGVGAPVKSRGRRPVRESLAACLDACHGWFDHQVERLPGDPQPVIAWLRPAWWILRAWVAVSLVDIFFGDGGYEGVGLVPSLMGLGLVVLAAAVFGSVMLGLGRFWPGGSRGLLARLVLLGLNSFALVMTPFALSSVDGSYGHEWDQGWQDGYNSRVAESESAGMSGSGPEGQLTLDGRTVTNIYPFDAEGRQLAGVQLFDQQGRPLEVSAEPYCPKGSDWEIQGSEFDEGGEMTVCHDSDTMSNVPGTVLYPWTNGQAQLKNVFPLASRQQETMVPSATAFQEAEPPTLGAWPFATVSRVSLPGIIAGVVEAAAAAAGADGPATAPSASPSSTSSPEGKAPKPTVAPTP
jgi:hypothetical protein